MSGEAPIDDALGAIYDALDRAEPEAALELAREALGEGAENDPVLRHLAGIALLAMDLPAEAAEELAVAVELDPDDADVRAFLALALFRDCRFDEAGRETRRALEIDETSPDAHAVEALLLERRGRMKEADAHFERATRLDPERFPAPVRLSREAFEAEVVRAGERLPPRFRRLLGEVAVTVEDVPSDAILREPGSILDPELLGLFVGTSIHERSAFDAVGDLPPRVLLFQRNLERHARDRDDLRDEIAITVYHELGHYLGLDEDDLEELDLA